MDNITFNLNEDGKCSFLMIEAGLTVAEMVFGVKENDLTVYHTEVLAEWEGKGLAHRLLTHMVAYARENNLMVIPLCPYVHLQFKRHPEMYVDLWTGK